MIEIDSLSCKYANKTVLSEITLDIEDHLTILGANGSGKSTLAKALCGLIRLEGKIEIDAQDIFEYDAKERAKKIAYIPTKLEFYDEFITLEEFVLFGRFPYKASFMNYTDKDKKVAREKIELLELCTLSKHPLSSLSSGETALALMAQALTQESDIIIFDEPTANLDPRNSKIIAKHIKGLKQTHQTVLITHDIGLANFIANPVLFLKNTEGFYFKKDFFTDENLSRLYEVEIESLAVKYE